MSTVKRDGWTFISSYKDKRPIGESRLRSAYGPWLYVIYKNKLYYGRCAYLGPYIGNYMWEILKAEKVPYIPKHPGKIYEETDKPPVITAWRDIPDLPEVPIKYKMRQASS